MPAIRTHDLTKIYRKSLRKPSVPSLDRLSLEIRQNEVYGFLGRNGAGKTTTIKLLCGLLKPTSGSAFIFDQSVRSHNARRCIGYLPENPYFYEYLTPRETLDFYGHLHGLDARQRSAEWGRLADLLDLADIADERVRGFSKGMRQRLGFAAALVGDPQLLILDEPMSGLDPMGRRQFRKLILYLRDEKKTIFFSSHVLSDVEQICDRVAILQKGRLMVQGGIAQLLQDKISLVEVIIAGLSVQDITDLAKGFAVRQSEAGAHFFVSDLAAANDLVQKAQAIGGTLAEFTPVKQTLEDYFVAQTEPAALPTARELAS